jgi:toxin ParE1/3/4
MAKFFLTNKAVEDLVDIWYYTIEIWSTRQAERYYNLLIDACQELANKPVNGKKYDSIEKHILGFKVGQHIIFYQIVSSDEIEVVRILHGMMDLKSKF